MKGSIVAIVTPMHANGDINFNDLEKLINWHVDNGTNGIVAVGTTGESPSLNFKEHIDVIKKTIEFVQVEFLLLLVLVQTQHLRQ